MPLSSVQEIANDILADQTCKRLYVVRTQSPEPVGPHMSCCTCFRLPAGGSSSRPKLHHTWLLLFSRMFLGLYNGAVFHSALWDLRMVLLSGCMPNT